MDTIYYGHNGDDCISSSVINGARNVFATNGFFGFPSHISMGSLGSNGFNQTVQGVFFKNWPVDGAVYGARESRLANSNTASNKSCFGSKAGRAANVA
ncbi:hypothetical protein B0H12DRAFT_1106984 [Mycena haematopus]|nr:hypothetical protein B0H12DRAFT_1106984 [Mycena haematopus]